MKKMDLKKKDPAPPAISFAPIEIQNMLNLQTSPFPLAHLYSLGGFGVSPKENVTSVRVRGFSKSIFKDEDAFHSLI